MKTFPRVPGFLILLIFLAAGPVWTGEIDPVRLSEDIIPDLSASNPLDFMPEETKMVCAPFTPSHTLTLEYRSTELFEEPALPLVGPPPEQVFYLSETFQNMRDGALSISVELFMFEEVDNARRVSAEVVNSHDDYETRWGLQFTDSGGEEDGLGLLGEYRSSWGPNTDFGLGYGLIMNDGGTAGVKLNADLQIYISSVTALALDGYVYQMIDALDSAGAAEVRLAQYLGGGWAAHVGSRWYGSAAEDFDNVDSLTGDAEIRKTFAHTTIIAGYRLYGDSQDVTAAGPSLGVEQEFDRGSAAVFYRYYETDEKLEAGSWWLRVMLKM
ncbi:hypothetical protein ACFL4W_04725 [Planctomycetota bacterium]